MAALKLAPVDANQAYLFRHALLRDAAYQLHLPGDRSRLHLLAFEILESLGGGRPPEAPRPDEHGLRPDFLPCPADPFAAELAAHAALSRGTAPAGARSLYLRRAAEYAETRFQSDSAAALWRELARESPDADRGDPLLRAAVATERAGRPREAEPLFEEAISLLHPGRRAAALLQFANVYRVTGRVALAEKACREALELHRAAGRRRQEGFAIGNLGLLLFRTGRLEEAERALHDSLDILREAGDRRSESISLMTLGTLYYETGRTDHAERTYGQALALMREVRDRRLEGIALQNLGNLHLRTGRFAEALRFAEAALACNRESGDRHSEGITRWTKGSILRESGDIARAEQEFARSGAILEDVDDRRLLGILRVSEASGEIQRGSLPRARERCLQGLSLLRETRDRRSEGHAVAVLARIDAAEGRAEEAEAHWREGIALERETRSNDEGQDRCHFALFLVRQGRAGKGREEWARGMSLMRAAGQAGLMDRMAAPMRAACLEAGVEPLQDDAPSSSPQPSPAPGPG